MASSRLRLEELNRECEAICLDRSNWTTKWNGTGPKGTANFRLIYSSPETFDEQDGIMFLWTNPGGGDYHADIHDPWVPFASTTYSSYVDDFGGDSPKGQHPMQRATQNVAAAFAGNHVAAAALLRRSPTGNLVPFRSVNLPALPTALRRRGLEFGMSLIDLARPKVLVLLSSNGPLWDSVMAHLGHSSDPDWKKDLGAHFIVREAVYRSADGNSRFVFALPGLNTSTQTRTPEVLALLRQRIAEHGLAV